MPPSMMPVPAPSKLTTLTLQVDSNDGVRWQAKLSEISTITSPDPAFRRKDGGRRGRSGEDIIEISESVAGQRTLSLPYTL